MKAIRVHAVGGPEVLRYEDVPPPTPQPGQGLVQVEAAGVNFIDTYQRSGFYKVALPFTLGQEAAGVVTGLGPGVGEPAVGAWVAYTNVLGAYAQYAAVPADRVVVLPSGLAAKQGAAVMVQGMTAHYLTTTTYPLQSGDTCLVHAAAGGVGLLLCQIAKLKGARVLATVSTEEKAALARAAGADEGSRHTEQDVEAEVQRPTGGQGLQAEYDPDRNTTLAQGLNSLARPRAHELLRHPA